MRFPGAILTILLCGNIVSAKTVSVHDTGGLTAALAQHSPGDSIILESGIYEGSFEIATPIVLIGNNNAIIDGLGKSNVLSISADSVVIEGITIRNSGTRLLKDMAGLKITGNHVTITNCKIEDILHGVYVKGGNSISILNNVIIGRFGIQEADRGNGIHLWNTANNFIEGNDISYARDGIYFSFAHKTTVKNNHIHRLRYALHYMYSNDNSFENNLFDYNVAGSALMYSKNIEFKRNIFAHCRGFRAYGILLQSVDYLSATDNLILDNTKGLFFDDANYCFFANNDIVQNDMALQINASCEENSFIGNNFISNLAHCMMDASIIENTYWAENDRGNYWSDYDGYDLDNNGIGDIPHNLQNIFEYIESDNPAIRFYLYSPASQLLAVAEKRLPILRKTAVQDPYPLFEINANDDVPWENSRSEYEGASLPHAVLWLTLALLPTVMILRMRK
ncbi:MAG: nitrous oxide reductase family maturation protein NosD [candidate division Zixibacteria bacterium]